LKRPGDPTSVAGWVTWMRQNNATREQMQLQLLGSAEDFSTGQARLGLALS